MSQSRLESYKRLVSAGDANVSVSGGERLVPIPAKSSPARFILLYISLAVLETAVLVSRPKFSGIGLGT